MIAKLIVLLFIINGILGVPLCLYRVTKGKYWKKLTPFDNAFYAVWELLWLILILIFLWPLV